MAAVGSLAMGVITKSQQRGYVTVRDQPDRSAITAVATVRSTLGDMGFTSEGNAARATITGLYMQVAFVDEVRHSASLDTAGLDTAGLDTADTAGLDTAGLDTAGLDTAGLDTAGLDTAGLDTAGLDTAGLDTAGLDTAGVRDALGL